MRVYKSLTSLSSEDLSLLENNPKEFWKGIVSICAIFRDSSIKNLKICAPVKSIGEYTFKACNELETIDLPDTLEEVGYSAFMNCKNLKTIEIPKLVKELLNWTFYKCISLETVTLPKGLKEIGYETFGDCINLKSIVIPKSIKIIDSSFDGCDNLEFITLPYNIEKAQGLINGKEKIRYAYINKKEKRIYFTKDLPSSDKNIINIVDLNILRNSFYCFDDYAVEFMQERNNKIIDAAKVLNKLGMKLPYSLVKNLVKEGKFEIFIQNSHFTFFKKEVAGIIDEIAQKDTAMKEALFTFAVNLGCFSKEKLLDSSGKETNTYFYQKASSLFVEMYKKGVFYHKVNAYASIYGLKEINLQPNQKFLEFLSFKQNKDVYPNLDLIISLNRQNPQIISQIMPEFNKVLDCRTYILQGKPKTRSWHDSIEKFLATQKFIGVTSENIDLAEEFNNKDLSQKDFDKALEIRKTAKKNNVPAHILNKPIKEDSILQSIEKIKKYTNTLLDDSKTLIDQLYDKQFTYEFLAKTDPKNFVLGAYCSCCATIDSKYYGSTITEVSVSKKDIQNLVVRDFDGNIIAKTTLYLNRELGYAVLNDFEINQKFKSNESRDSTGNIVSGVYADDMVDTKESNSRRLIFKAFMRGIKAFIEEYDKQNPNKPLKQVNVGLGFNRLKSNCMDFDWTVDGLKVPKEYKFKDAEEMQCILYKKDQPEYNLLMEK